MLRRFFRGKCHYVFKPVCPSSFSNITAEPANCDETVELEFCAESSYPRVKLLRPLAKLEHIAQKSELATVSFCKHVQARLHGCWARVIAVVQYQRAVIPQLFHSAAYVFEALKTGLDLLHGKTQLVPRGCRGERIKHHVGSGSGKIYFDTVRPNMQGKRRGFHAVKGDLRGADKAMRIEPVIHDLFTVWKLIGSELIVIGVEYESVAAHIGDKLRLCP